MDQFDEKIMQQLFVALWEPIFNNHELCQLYLNDVGENYLCSVWNNLTRFSQENHLFDNLFIIFKNFDEFINQFKERTKNRLTYEERLNLLEKKILGE